MLDRLKRGGFDVLALHHAEAVLSHDAPSAIADIDAVLSALNIPVMELVQDGGGEADSTQRMRRDFANREWTKENIEVKKLVNGREVMSLSHEIDHVKRIGETVIALEIEWNDKDPFFDRDLEGFKRLHAEGAISVGIVITRGQSLHNNMRTILARFAREKKLRSLADLAPYGYEPTRRQRTIIATKESRGMGFRDAWVDAFASDKFGEATTHWRKLDDRVKRGVGNPGPLLLIGIPNSVVTF